MYSPARNPSFFLHCGPAGKEVFDGRFERRTHLPLRFTIMLNHVEYGFSSKNLCIRPRQPMGRPRDHEPQYNKEQVSMSCHELGHESQCTRTIAGFLLLPLRAAARRLLAQHLP